MQDEDQKNLLLAIVLAVAILLGWQMFYVNPKAKEERLKQAQSQQVPGALSPGTAQQPGAAQQPGTATSPPPTLAPVVTMTRDDALKAAQRVPIETPNLTGSISLKGGRLDDLDLVAYRETADPKSPPVALLSPTGSPEPYYAEFGWLAPPGTTVVPPAGSADWRLEQGTKLTPETPVTIVFDDGRGLIYRRKFSVDANFMFTVEDTVENNTAVATVLDHHAAISRHGTPKVAGFYILHEGPVGVAGDKGLQELTYANALKDTKDGDRNTKPFDKITGGWLGITDKYWATALIPDQTAVLDGYITGYAKDPRIAGSKESYQIDYVQRGVTTAPAASQSVTTRFYAGAKRVKLIEGYEKDLGIKKFDLMVDWGMFYFITKPLFHLIDWTARFFGGLGLTGNFGLAILFVTVLVKGAFFPLANKSYESMAKMKKLQPEIEALRERYKDDQPRIQQEMMQLYKKQKINPMAGCLPIALQIPVFFALYKVLFVTIDMRHAPFYGWIKDLSAPDPTTVFNLFGLLPFAVPDFLHVGLWPMIMGATMWFQMQLNPQQPDPIQQKIFNWMPVMFTFMLASFPVGLVIYWAWSNILSLIQQYFINKKNGAEIHLWKNMGLDKLQALLSRGNTTGKP